MYWVLWADSLDCQSKAARYQSQTYMDGLRRRSRGKPLTSLPICFYWCERLTRFTSRSSQRSVMRLHCLAQSLPSLPQCFGARRPILHHQHAKQSRPPDSPARCASKFPPSPSLGPNQYCGEAPHACRRRAISEPHKTNHRQPEDQGPRESIKSGGPKVPTAMQ